VKFLTFFSFLVLCFSSFARDNGGARSVEQSLAIAAVLRGQPTIPAGPSCEGWDLSLTVRPGSDIAYYHLTITLRNGTGLDYTPVAKDRIRLVLNPGSLISPPWKSGDKPAGDVFLPVARIGNKVQVCDPGEPDWAADWRGQQPIWTGMHDRYNAFLILRSGTAARGSGLPFITASLIDGPGFGSSSQPVMILGFSPGELDRGGERRWEFLLYSGPKSIVNLKRAPDNLDDILFPGLWNWMRWLCFGLMHLLFLIHNILPGWGWSIILLALLIRVLLYPFARKAMISQQRFNEAQKRMLPELKQIKSKWKGGEQSERILQLYKKHNVSPFAGIKPLWVVLIQLPVLIALFHVLGSVYELRDAGFLWIRSLAEPDQLFSFGFSIPLFGSYFNLLPVLMSLVTLLSFRLSPAPSDGHSGFSLQDLFMIVMTVMFFLLFYSFPSGMVLYWTFANLFHILQQKLLPVRPK
jgi:YidC/Oxa1 family membrane protein insertase